ncbi:hypothetical protein C7974DRAFT_320916 [Boeremia exigua]|uniref:uncharacterized protein n=1 Tax=Boeremia exigua TaxID=749465 RepID=UPI001E8D1A90|nr:uncharacterized protein C7974DRAFT_320916 [Boeremia exigua]KAH6614226.1 hypothetical protein C7974DRAFT_320916 [Boeremia exigua]
MSSYAPIDSSNDDTGSKADIHVDTDAVSQLTLLNAFDSDPEYDITAVDIWDHRRESSLSFAAYVKFCIILGWKECVRVSAWLWRKSWTAEICSFLFAIASLVGLVLFLSIHHGQPIPEWPHLITINSVVSLFALCMRIGVGVVLAEGCISQSKWHWFAIPRALHDMERFDLASRSALGSSRLLYFFARQGIFYVAIVGALAMVMVSLTGFFLQQLVQFDDCLQPNNTMVPRVSKTNSYSRAGALAAFNLTTENEPFMGMVAAINVAFFQAPEDYTNVLSQRCTSGFCTFPMNNGTSFTTVAISHLCEDLTSKVSISTPSLSRRGIASLTDDAGALIELDLDSDTIVTARTNPRKRESLSSLTTVYIINRSLDPISSKSSYLRPSSSDVEILKCSLFPSLNTYGVSITRSLINETLIESKPLEPYQTKNSQGMSYSFLTASTHTLRDGAQEPCVGSAAYDRLYFDSEYHKSDILDNGTVIYNSSALYYPRDCVWGFGEAAATGIQRYFNSIFDNQTLTLTDLKESKYRSIHLRQLWQNQTMSLSRAEKVMKDIATAMTAVVRTEGSEGSIWALDGTMFSTTTCVDIKWPWLTFPIVTIVLTGVFLVFMVWENRDVASDRLWKSSVLATLFCEVEHARMDETRTICKEAMIDMAKSTSVSVEGGKGTLKLVARG